MTQTRTPIEDDSPTTGSTAFLSRGQVAGLYGVSLSTVTRWARTGMIPTLRTPGGHYRFRAEDFRRASPTAVPDEGRGRAPR